jgi:simple sugar transport system permease protein
MALGCEGMMIAGAFFGVLGSFLTGSPWIGVGFGVLFGILISLIHATLDVKYKVNQTLSGMSVNLLGAAVAPLLLQLIWKSKGISPKVANFSKLNIGFLRNIPLIGNILAEQNILFYVTLILVVIGYIYMFKTPQGLRMRMVGENPVAASTVGINVAFYKYLGVIMSGALCGLAGAYLSLAQLDMYIDGMTAGRGYIAMVIATLGKNSPIGSLFASLFFGFFDSLQTVFQGGVIPSQVVMTLPYILTMAVVVFGLRGSRGPAGMGKHHDD